MCLCVSAELLYNLTADVDKRQRGLPSRIYFSQNGVQVQQLSHQLNLDINREVCQHYTAYVKVSPCARARVCVCVWMFASL